MNFTATPAPGNAIGDASRGGPQDCKWDFYDASGDYVGSIFDSGFAPHGVTGGVGAFYGVRGQMAGVTIPNPKATRRSLDFRGPREPPEFGGRQRQDAPSRNWTRACASHASAAW